MSTGMPDSSRRAVAVFRRMLGFYPNAFRREYEQKLILLFQDQLRDANAKRTMEAMVRFWVRMIVDTGCSAVRERWSELRRTMRSSSPTALIIYFLPTPRRRVSVMFLSALLVSLGVWWATPQTYVSTARLVLPAKDGVFDPYLIQTSLEQFWEPQTLERVARSFRSGSNEEELVKVFARNPQLTRLPGNTMYGRGTLQEDVRRMQRHLDVRAFGNTSIVQVQFAAGSPIEAAAIANRIAFAFQDRINGEARPQVELVDLAIPAIRPIAPNLGQALVFTVVFGFGGAGVLEGLLALARRSAKSIPTA